MTFQHEFIANTGPYQHVKMVVESKDPADLFRQLDLITDEVKRRLALFQAEYVSWVSGTYEQIINGQHVEIVQEVATALGATVVEETTNPPAPALQTGKPKPWEKSTAALATDLDSF